jgi:hypothetical protein
MRSGPGSELIRVWSVTRSDPHGRVVDPPNEDRPTPGRGHRRGIRAFSVKLASGELQRTIQPTFSDWAAILRAMRSEAAKWIVDGMNDLRA